MAEDLQGLLEKIQQQGIDKAKSEYESTIHRAEEEADKIIEAAKREAAEIRRGAESDAVNLSVRAESAVRQAARDIIIKLEGELRSRLAAAVRENTAAAMTPQFMSTIIKEMVDNFLQGGKKASSLEVLVSPRSLEELTLALGASLRGSFAGNPVVLADPDIEAGIKVAINGNDLFFDFSDNAVTNIVSSYIGPRLAAILKAE